MDKIDHLRQHGLFDAKVPRYTSYPPANHFESGVGQRHQLEWLQAVPDGSDISVYIHIPFCKRLCWFCACRTQGTKTMRPVDAYVDVLRKEIEVVRHALPKGVRMGRLHLGGGTPTILPSETMSRLLTDVFAAFEPAPDFEFSVEIDPTEASDSLLDTLIAFGMNRASLGVQDFAPEVQKAIGREQSLVQTKRVVEILRRSGGIGLNLDLLYGLPHQTERSFLDTLASVTALCPDRLAIYGYAHVPWMSKRQVMIRSEDLPGAEARFDLAEIAHDVMVGQGYVPIGIDHFALPQDGLAIAAAEGRLRRNFQGYTDDRCPTLIGLGASSISRFPLGYIQNAAATSAYQERILGGGLAGHKGYEMTQSDGLVARIVEDLMCRFSVCEQSLRQSFPGQSSVIRQTVVSLMNRFPDCFFISEAGLEMKEEAKPLVRVIASFVDKFAHAETAHSAAI
ncbi:oxygen-independent coproporphyrinogen III oxidase [Flavimaricola marinus]|uniref:Coproporphyrinogen-III oxidase n=1 Tax=Flavimaricola marinus TaxID=1819565 RepID=A0A238LFF0_9RHOB|nr:oxygen-independent coproporphyrinogen III oxidase [Flavimaricola marinus]SMY08303.1 Oxygen-independent coproporphyrinogen-III oxidase [Flavimaricola marinus]